MQKKERLMNINVCGPALVDLLGVKLVAVSHQQVMIFEQMEHNGSVELSIQEEDTKDPMDWKTIHIGSRTLLLVTVPLAGLPARGALALPGL